MSKQLSHERFSSKIGLDAEEPPASNREPQPLVPFATTLIVRDTCLCLHVQRAARSLARRFDDALRPLGLTNSQFSLLMALNRPSPPPMGPVAALLAMDRTTLTAALKRLEARGLVQVMRDPTDRRSRLLALTEAGGSLLAKAVPIWQESHVRLEAKLGNGEAIRLRQDLAALG
ncbi:winged helix-turn-helix transcriptional regulator [Labrys sp. KNU-23]|uniref:MarR family winged helix-turn-helix transcriptional regulator n=1 Tax=Labrys sp. KNU-23 TaxID=2789216 RepID=UPI0011EF7D85|nr:MarR family winged helix-turn-helix transcriptional regulator [Labrys sp. KNU-23]QEN87857.1 winged helix-turn-helix transcriptional regulator [Labrys sp. KNU-23]